MLSNILTLRPDSKLYLAHSGCLTRVPELPAGWTCLPSRSSQTALVHPHTRMCHLLDGFHKVRILVSLHRISLNELLRGHKRRNGRNVLSSKIFTNNQKNVIRRANAQALTCSSGMPFHVWEAWKHYLGRIWTPWACWLTWKRGAKRVKRKNRTLEHFYMMTWRGKISTIELQWNLWI